jgi:2-methylisocitrate lyase-like PEP mutase family enzyme
MNLIAQQQKAAHFLKLHDRSRILVLPNAWDVVSARIVEEAGFPAIATTSAGIAWMLGYPDGQFIRRDEMLDIIWRIAGRVKLPVTADMEAGYGDRPEDAAKTARGVLEAGAIGMNLEDGTHDPKRPLVDAALHQEKIKAVREVAVAAGVPLVLNARTDVFLAGVGEPSTRLNEAVRRANTYREAGADCLFVPGVHNVETIGRLAKEINGPLNILAAPGVPPIAELAKLGVARVSVGGALKRATLTLLRKQVLGLRDGGVHASFTEGSVTGGEVNEFFA